jgi:hypothetical protein
MNVSFSEIAIVEVVRLLSPLKDLNTRKLAGFVKDLGWDVGNIKIEVEEINLNKLNSLYIGASDKIILISNSKTDEEKLSAVTELAKILSNILGESKKVAGALEIIVQNIQKTNHIPGLPINENFGLLTQRVFDNLVYSYLQKYHQRVFAFLHILGIAEIEVDDEGMSIKKIQWERISKLFTPLELLNKIYHWDSAFLHDKFLERIEVFLRGYNIPGGIYTQDESIRKALNREIGDDKEIRLPISQSGVWPNSYTEIDLNFSPIPKKDEHNIEGLFLYPYLMSGATFDIDLSESWKVIFKGALKSNTNIGLEIRPPAKFQLVTNSFDGNPDSLRSIPNSHIEFSLCRKGGKDQLNYIFGSPNTSHLGFKSTGFNFIAAQDNNKQELAFEMMVDDLTLKIDMSEGDGFLQKILAGVQIETVTDLVIGISNQDGFYFRGSGALEIEIPLHKSLGPVTFQALYLRFVIADQMELQFAVSLGFELGPVSGSVDKIGIGIPFSISNQNNGNLGPVDIQGPKFLPPMGAGLALNAGPIIGGGYLEFDHDNKRYAGILSLKIGEIALVAIGLITTRMPDGSKGFSLLVNIGVTFSPPIQLSFGFTLNAVGGLVGINRTMDIEVLQVGIKNRTFDSILFPDPDTVIQNAPKIISDLRSVFPPYSGRFVVGPMVKIGWGSPPVITGDVGIFIDFPAPVRVVLLGQVEAILPEKENAVVQIHLDILGVLDIEKKELSFQASLYDSKILTYDIYGDAAMLVAWGKDPRFAMSMGGFHPRFTPPQPAIVFGDLKPLSISISNSNKIRLTCSSYQAITTNTLQFGARVDGYFSFSGVTATGFMGYDALFYFDPFSFVADLGGGMNVKYKGVTLADLDLNCRLSGPNPWNAKGQAKFKILFKTFKKRFNITWGDSEKRRLASRDPWPELLDSVNQNGNWSCTPPASSGIATTLRSLEDDEDGILLVHPSGTLQYRQRLLPFDIALDKTGNSPISGHDKFEIEKITAKNVEGAEETIEFSGIYEDFSRGQYQELSDNQKLALPSFEKMKAGVSSQDEGFEIFGKTSSTVIGYESILIDSDRVAKPTSKSNKGSVPFTEFDRMQQSWTDRRSRQSNAGNRFHHPERGAMTSTPSEELYVLANTQNLSTVGETDGDIIVEESYARIVIDEIFEEQSRLSPGLIEDLMIITTDELEIL